MQIRSLHRETDNNLTCTLITFGKTTLLFDCAIHLSPQTRTQTPLQHDPTTISTTSTTTPQKRKPHVHDLKDNTNSNTDYYEHEEREQNIPSDSNSSSTSPLQPPLYLFRCPNLSEVDWSAVTFILLTDPENALGLPFVTETTKFKGKVYATEPVKELGRLLMEETVGLFGYRRYGAPPFQKDPCLRTIYTLAQVEVAYSKITAVRYDEHVNSVDGIRITAYSAGYSLGSANWLVESNGVKLALMSRSSTVTMTHPSPFNATALLRSADYVLADGMKSVPAQTYDASLNRIGQIVGSTLLNKGSVIFPVRGTGIAYDILEHVSQHMSNMGSHTIRFYFFSSIAEKSLQYANISGEWMDDACQEKLHSAEPPLHHGTLLREERLLYGKHLDSTFSRKFVQPCIVFCGHTSLMEGPVLHLLRLWGRNPNHAMILTDLDNSAARRELLRLSSMPPANVEPIFDTGRHPPLPKKIEIQIHECILDKRLDVKETLRVLDPHPMQTILMPAACERKVAEIRADVEGENRDEDDGDGFIGDRIRYFGGSASTTVIEELSDVEGMVPPEISRGIMLQKKGKVTFARVTGTWIRTDDGRLLLNSLDPNPLPS